MKNPQKRRKYGVFRFLTAPWPPKKIIALVVTCSLLIHAFYALFEVNRLRKTSVIGKKSSKTSKLGCFSKFYAPPDPKSKIGLRQCTRLRNTRILRGHWRKSAEKQKSLSVYAFTNMVVPIIIKWKYTIHAGKRPTYRVFSYQLGGVLCQLVE